MIQHCGEAKPSQQPNNGTLQQPESFSGSKYSQRVSDRPAWSSGLAVRALPTIWTSSNVHIFALFNNKMRVS